MTATNHALTGAVIGLTISQPWLALPIAFISHFICDSLPHFGPASYEERVNKKKIFHRILFFDSIILATVMGLLVWSGAGLLVFSCLFLAGSPDIVWAYRYIFKEDFGKKPFPPMNGLSRFHSRIQWSQTLIPGFYIELIYGLVMIGLIIKLL